MTAPTIDSILKDVECNISDLVELRTEAYKLLGPDSPLSITIEADLTRLYKAKAALSTTTWNRE